MIDPQNPDTVWRIIRGRNNQSIFVVKKLHEKLNGVIIGLPEGERGMPYDY